MKLNKKTVAICLSHILFVTMLLLLLSFIDIKHIAQVFEDKSLCSYELKSGDLNLSSPSAKAHRQISKQ